MSDRILPTLCPSCQRVLRVVRLACDGCGAAVEGDFGLPVLTRLDAGDQTFLLNLLKSSGSLKELARTYGVSYPTVRNRLDALIEKAAGLESDTSRQEEE